MYKFDNTCDKKITKDIKNVIYTVNLLKENRVEKELGIGCRYFRNDILFCYFELEK